MRVARRARRNAITASFCRRDSAKALFGLPPAEAGSNLTLRREAAAKVLEREVNHFRKRVEPQILTVLARTSPTHGRQPGKAFTACVTVVEAGARRNLTAE